MYEVGCTLKTVGTSLSCDLEIGVKNRQKNGFRPFWRKIGGRLDLGASAGVWFYYAPDGERIGIVLFPSGPIRAEFWGVGSLLATLLGVPNRFSERLRCGQSWGGEGRLQRTAEAIDWRMWYPCV